MPHKKVDGKKSITKHAASSTSKHIVSQKSNLAGGGGNKAGAHKRKYTNQLKAGSQDEFPFPVSGNSSVFQHKRDSAR